MKFILSTALLAAAFLASSVEARWQPTPKDGQTWDYLLGAHDDVM